MTEYFTDLFLCILVTNFCFINELISHLDCPQVHALHDYQAQQSDELSLVPGDVVNVLRKLPDGKKAFQVAMKSHLRNSTYRCKFLLKFVAIHA
jgi:hypothetical protein